MGRGAGNQRTGNFCGHRLNPLVSGGEQELDLLFLYRHSHFEQLQTQSHRSGRTPEVSEVVFVTLDPFFDHLMHPNNLLRYEINYTTPISRTVLHTYGETETQSFFQKLLIKMPGINKRPPKFGRRLKVIPNRIFSISNCIQIDFPHENPSPLSLSDTHWDDPITRWSSTFTDNILPAWTRARVTWTSSGLGPGSPEG